jgi:hypothetical protein
VRFTATGVTELSLAEAPTGATASSTVAEMAGTQMARRVRRLPWARLVRLLKCKGSPPGDRDGDISRLRDDLFATATAQLPRPDDRFE